MFLHEKLPWFEPLGSLWPPLRSGTWHELQGCWTQLFGTSRGGGCTSLAVAECNGEALLLAKVEVERAATAAMAKASKAPVKQLHQVRIASSGLGSKKKE